MNRETNIEQFEELMNAIERPGIDKLMDYIRKSDFYTAPGKHKVSFIMQRWIAAA